MYSGAGYRLLNRFSISAVDTVNMVGRPWGQVWGFCALPRRRIRWSISSLFKPRAGLDRAGFTGNGSGNYLFPFFPRLAKRLFHQLMQHVFEHPLAVAVGKKGRHCINAKGSSAKKVNAKPDFLKIRQAVFHNTLLLQVKMQRYGEEESLRG